MEKTAKDWVHKLKRNSAGLHSICNNAGINSDTDTETYKKGLSFPLIHTFTQTYKQILSMKFRQIDLYLQILLFTDCTFKMHNVNDGSRTFVSQNCQECKQQIWLVLIKLRPPLKMVFNYKNPYLFLM